MQKTYRNLVQTEGRHAKLSKRNCDIGALIDGIEDGSEVDLNKPVTGTKQALLI